MRKTVKNLFHILVSFLVLILIWQAAVSIGKVSPALFPGPANVLAAWKELLLYGLAGSTSDISLIGHIGVSLIRFFTGYILAVITAIILGLLLGWFKGIFAYVNPVIQVIRPIAPVAWMPFIVLWFGIGDVPAIVIIFIAAFFPVLLSTVKAVKTINPTYLLVARNFNLSKKATLIKIVFPAIFSQIINSLHLALGTAWIFLVSGEMVGSQSGLGFLIMDTKNCMRMDSLLAVILTIGGIGFVLDLLIQQVEIIIEHKTGYGISS